MNDRRRGTSGGSGYGAFREYHQALAAGQPPEEIRHLEEGAEWLFRAVSTDQLRALSGAAGTLQ